MVTIRNSLVHIERSYWYGGGGGGGGVGVKIKCSGVSEYLTKFKSIT